MAECSMQDHKRPFKDYVANHFKWSCSEDGRVATITLNRPEKKNPLTFDSYAELRDLFRNLANANDVRSVVIQGEGGNFCSGSDVFEIIEPLTKMSMPELLRFTRMTGDLVLNMRRAPQPIISAIDGFCAGAGAMVALASDFRLGTPLCKVAFLFSRVGLSGADMGACGLLPRVIGLGRANELLMSGRVMSADEGLSWGFYNQLHPGDVVLSESQTLARQLADGPWFAHSMTKTMINQEWSMGIPEMIESEAQAQAICMMTGDFRRAFEAFAAKVKPKFEGN